MLRVGKCTWLIRDDSTLIFLGENRVSHIYLLSYSCLLIIYFFLLFVIRVTSPC